MLPLDEAHPGATHAFTTACAVIDIQAELRFWESCYTRQGFHHVGVPFRHYVPTLKFAYDTYLLSPHAALEDLLPALAARYERSVLQGMRLDWRTAQDILIAVWRRLGAPTRSHAQPSMFLADALDERAIVAAAMQQNDTASSPHAFTLLPQR